MTFKLFVTKLFSRQQRAIGILIAFVLVFTFQKVRAQDYSTNTIQNYFKKISVEEGLSGANVNAIVKDKWGFVWVGTEYGLNRYDGTEFVVYTANPNQDKAISSNLIYDIAADDNGDLWVATLNGLNRYNHLTENFDVFYEPGKKNIFTDIAYDEKAQKIWITANNDGLLYFDMKQNKLVSAGFEKLNPLRVEIMGDSLVLGTKKNGISIVHKNTLKLLRTIESPMSSPILALAITKDFIWAGTSKSGILKIDRTDFDKVINYTASNSRFNALGALSIMPDHSGNLLLGTDGRGLYVLRENQFYQISNTQGANSLKSTAIRSIYVDQKNDIWLGTYAKGIAYQPHTNRTIINYQNNPTNTNSLSNNFVLSIEEGPDNTLYIGTDRGGINEIYKNKFTQLSVPGDVALSLHLDSSKRLWVGTYQNGVYYYEKNKLHSLSKIVNDTTFDESSVWSIKEDTEGNIWFALTQFLLKLNKADFSYSKYQNQEHNSSSLINSTIRSLYWDNHKRLWIGTLKGISILDTNKDEFILQNSLKPISTRLVSTLTGNDSLVFAGTNGHGIYVFNKNAKLIRILTKSENNLAHNMVLGLVLDKSGFLWATTPNGISRINLTTWKADNFNSSDGFIGNTFNPRSIGRLSNGYLAFGSTQGLSVFNPDSIKKSEDPPKTYVTGLQVVNKQIPIDTTILSKSITFTEHFTLPAHSNSFILHYVGLNYGNPKKTEYKFQLQGFENEWRMAGHNTMASYTNLAPGEYIFKIKASNGTNFWSQTPTQIGITILPYWWQTIYAKMGAILLLILLTYSIIQIRTRTLSNQKSALAAQVAERTHKLETAYNRLSEFNNQLEIKVAERTEKLEKSNSELDRFVYSASHDLSAPLKSIKGLLNLAKVDTGTSIKTYLDKITLSIEKLEEVIKNLIQFSRNARQKVRNEPIDLEQLTEGLKEELIYIDAETETENISCNVNVLSTFNLRSDPVRLKIILSNLISNAIKYRTPTQLCEIDITGEKTQEGILISVSDNGIGIEPEYIPKIFDMFFRGTTLSDGSGLGLFIVKEAADKLNARLSVDSTPGKGSTFRVLFPV